MQFTHYDTKYQRNSRFRAGVVLARIPLIVIALLVSVIHVGAQEPPERQRIEIQAPDGVTLVGDLFVPDDAVDQARPAVVLMHMLGSARGVWRNALVPDLLDAGYVALAIDLRGHGESGGERTNWALTEADVYEWLDWLRGQPGIDPDRVSLVGGSLGANLALRVMAEDERIVTAVSLSPYVEARGMTTDDAMQKIDDRPVYLVAGQEDTEPAESVRALLALAQGDILARLYPHSVHGTALFVLEADLAPSIITWLNTHN